MVVAAGLVGSGELIATTKTGAQAGIGLLWVIVLGCVIKVFTQVELGRYAVSTGHTTLAALNQVPGPRLGANWVIWLWLIMMASTYGLLAGVLGGVAQTLEMIFDQAAIQSATRISATTWATVVAIGTSLLLYFGRYALLQSISVAMVLFFVVVTVGNVIALQTTAYAIPATAILEGLTFDWPHRPDVWLTALAAFGIIGMGGTDLIAYPYWCLERGYGRFIGAESEPGWAARAHGWLRVMKVDAFFAMVVYTLTTVAFFFIGAAVLHREGSDPDGMQMVATIASAYVPVFGEYAKALFLSGALAVLYSSFLVANAGASFLFTDCLRILGVIGDSERARYRTRSAFSLTLPVLVLLIFLTGWNPVRLIVFGGLVQAIVVPAIAYSALYFRYRLVDERLRPGRVWDVALVLSALSLLVVGLFSLYRVFQ